MSEDLHDRNEFSVFQSIAAVLAYVARTVGLDGVRHVLARVHCRSERLIAEAAVLDDVGLTDLAKLLRQHARARDKDVDSRLTC